jgi:hypothetical protein
MAVEPRELSISKEGKVEEVRRRRSGNVVGIEMERG